MIKIGGISYEMSSDCMVTVIGINEEEIAKIREKIRINSYKELPYKESTVYLDENKCFQINYEVIDNKAVDNKAVENVIEEETIKPKRKRHKRPKVQNKKPKRQSKNYRNRSK